ncbi:MAG: hypothetical protein PHO20_02455 [Candidatus Peribacteraceae bacterium]|nr:hypothetical protein [Candidatus Peribacteraceae bacterium]MDD5739605.1 hypothetical protein [Candidatus Peribacteraceae bacterium]
MESTTRCHFHCSGCYMTQRHALNKGEMSLERAIRFLDLSEQYLGRNLETMDILGGEPLQWPPLPFYIEELLRREIKPWIFTNMVEIDPNRASWLLERGVFITGKLNIADPGDPEQMALQAELIGSTVEMAGRMIKGIDVLLAAGYREPFFRLENLMRRKNLHLVPGFIEFCRARGIGMDVEIMGSCVPLGPHYFEVAPTAQELADLVRTLMRTGDGSSGSILSVDQLLMPHMFGSCRFFDSGLYFAVDGTIRACSNSNVVLAHIDDPDPIRTAYESPLICARKALTRTSVGQPCGSCDRWEQCRGGCRATVEATGDPFGGYPLCPLPLLCK